MSGLVGVLPAQAAQSLTLGPVAGSTLESIRESGVLIRADIAEATEGFKFRITSQTPSYTTDQLFDDINDGDVTLTATYADTPVIGHNAVTGALVEATEDSLINAADIPTACTPVKTVGLEGGTIVVSFFENDGCTSNEAVGDREDDSYFNATATSVMYLGIKAADSTTNTDLVVDVRSHIDAGVYNDNNDADGSGLADGDNQINAGEVVSTIKRVTLYDSFNVTATTTIEALAVNQQIVTSVTFSKPELNTYFVTTFSIGNVVSSAAYNSTSTTVASAFAWSTYIPQVSADWVTTENAELDTDNKYNFPLEATTSGATVVVGNYAARASYNTDNNPSSGDWVTWLGARTANSGLIAGGNANVTGVYATVTDSANTVMMDEDEVFIRTSTKSATVTAQITADDGADDDLTRDDLAASNVRVKATFSSYGIYDEDTDISFAGSTIIMDEDRDAVVLYGRTDADGQADFTFTSSDPEGQDTLFVQFEVLNSAGVWVYVNGEEGSDNLYLTWADAWLDDFDVDPSGPVSGSSISLTYSAVDQFGEPISTTGTDSEDAFEVTLFGTDGSSEQGTLNDDVLLQTKPLVSGRATFTFDNYASMDSFVWVTGILHQVRDGDIDARDDGYDLSGTEGYSDWDDWDRSGYSDLDTQVFKNDATAEISSVDNEYFNVVTYQAFKAGNYSNDEAFYDFVNEDGLYNYDYNEDTPFIFNNDDDEQSQITGTVETKNGNGAVAQQVTISGAGLLFAKSRNDGYDEIHALNSITVWTDVDGNFEVDVYSHLENRSGLSVTISSGGKSFTTKLFTYMNPDISSDEYYNVGEDYQSDASVLTWNWNKVTGNAPSANTQYTITISAKDVWGNLLRNLDIDVHPNGWAEVGGARFDEIDEDDNYHSYTDSNGKTTFTVEKGMWYWNLDEDVDEVDFLVSPSGNVGTIDADICCWEYDSGRVDGLFDFDTYDGFYGDVGVGNLEASFKFGPQATAKAGVKKGVVVANAYNVKGKTVRVYVAGKLVKTVTSDKAQFLVRVKGIKAGDKRVTVKVGTKRMFSGYVSVK
jgi:hypothetical protein